MPQAPAVYPTEAETRHLVPGLEGRANNTRAYGASVVAWVILADMDILLRQTTTQSSRQELQEDPSDVAAAAQLTHQAAQQGLKKLASGSGGG